MKMETATTTMQILELIYMGGWFRKKEIEIALEEKTSRTIANAIFQLKQTGEISTNIQILMLKSYVGKVTASKAAKKNSVNI
jgi:hypothetical protein